jgi:nitroreductase
VDAIQCLPTRRRAGDLVKRGPDADRRDPILRAAVTAPHPGRLRPWRFVVVPGDAGPPVGAAAR